MSFLPVSSRCWPFVLVAVAFGAHPSAEADAPPDPPRYVTFCCQPSATADPAVSSQMPLRFGPCFEASDTRHGRMCRSDSVYYYPVAVRTDRTFSFDNSTRELTIFSH